MSKCLKCGAELPPVGECPACAAVAASQPPPPAVPSLLDKDIQIDRRHTPERTPAIPGPAVPSFSELAHPASPPGMTPPRPTPAVAPAQPPVRMAAPPPPPPSPMPSQASAAPRPPGMTPAQRLPVPPPMPAAQATPPAMPPAQRQPFLSPTAPTPPMRIPVPPMAAQSQASIPTPPMRIPVPASVQAPAATQHVPPPGARASMPAPRVAADDPDSTAPGEPPFQAPRPAPVARASVADPNDTLPGGPAYADTLPPVSAPSAMATAAQRAEMPMPSEAPRPQAMEAAPPSSRPVPAPVPVVTFAPPAAHPVAPAVASEPAAPAPAPARSRTGATAKPSPSTGVQEIHARPASLWRRLLSFTIDAVALVGVATLYITVASAITHTKAPSAQGLTTLDSIAAWMHALKSVLVPGIVLLLVLATVYCAIAAFLWNGRTLGRLLLGLRLVDTHGVPPPPTRAILRAVLSVVSFGLFLGGFWMAIFDRRGQTLHDKLTSTFVVQPS